MSDELIIAGMASLFRTPEDDEKECKLTEEQAINRLCALMSEVREHLGGPADCFCPGRFKDPTGYRNDGTAIEFIERATRCALGKSEKP